MILVYVVTVLISNTSVSIQLGVAMPVLAVVFTLIQVFRDPEIRLTQQDRRFALIATLAMAAVSGALGIITILAVYISPALPNVLPDHNLISSWEINFVDLGFTREEALEKLNLGYVWHAMSVFMYMVFVLGSALVTTICRSGGSGDMVAGTRMEERPMVTHQQEITPA